MLIPTSILMYIFQIISVFIYSLFHIFCKVAKRSITSSQKKALVQFMENFPNLRKGKFSIHFTTAAMPKNNVVECLNLLNNKPRIV